ncbi:hypothetical protein AA313_de0200462 [Arthrobotrys entomopaga]|nr:hypothetical protein AA313_de0200462 [Arthrobotrys entomopaga]
MSTYDDVMDTSSDKGKGRALEDPSNPIAERVEEEGEDSSDEEQIVDEHDLPADDVVPDPLEEIDTSNIIQGSRTRGNRVDYATADQAGLIEEDDEDDADFQDKSAEEIEDVDEQMRD